MSRTYAKGERRGRARGRVRGRSGKAADFTRRVECPERLTAEWAVGRMAGHVNYVVEQMVEDGEIPLSDKQDYVSIVNRRICRALPAYRADGERGRGASILNFLTVVVANELGHIRSGLRRLKRNRRDVPVCSLPPKEAERLGYVSESVIGDGCRGVRELELRMDVNTLRGMLRPLELEVFDMRAREFTYPEIGAELGISRFSVMRVMAGIREKALACGFVPSRGREGGCDE